MSSYRNVLLPKCPVTEMSITEMSITKVSFTKMSWIRLMASYTTTRPDSVRQKGDCGWMPLFHSLLRCGGVSMRYAVFIGYRIPRVG